MTSNHLLVGIGAGPANLSLAALLQEALGGESLFLERREQVAWHPGLMFAGTRLQTHWVKDLVTLADPTNRFSFLNYLKETGRLYDFLIADFGYMPRPEFERYQRWVAAQLANVRFGAEVREISFDGGFCTVTADGTELLSRDLVVGVGTRPHIPACLRDHVRDGAGGRVVPASRLDQADPACLGGLADLTTVVVGGGQTGAEAVLELMRRGAGPIRWYSRRSNFSPLDESPFANELYRPSYLEHFHALPTQERARLVREQQLTSDGISMDTLRELYQACYETELRTGRSGQVAFLPDRELVAAEEGADGSLLLDFDRRSGGSERQRADLVVLATGVEPAPVPFAPELTALFETDERGDLVVGEDYALRWRHGDEHAVYVQNRSRHAHGVADPNLSLLAVRSARIANSVLGKEYYPVLDRGSDVIW